MDNTVDLIQSLIILFLVIRNLKEDIKKLGKKKKVMKKVFIRPIGDGDSIVYYEDKDGYEVQLETPQFEEYSEAMEWCEENGYEWEEE